MKTKTCATCGIRKSRADFHANDSNRSGLAWECKKCVRQRYQKNRKAICRYNNERNQQNQRMINKAKNKPCADCHIIYPSCVMDFDHVRGCKEFNLGTSCCRSEKNILKEIDKCEVVCANCHRLRTFGGPR